MRTGITKTQWQKPKWSVIAFLIITPLLHMCLVSHQGVWRCFPSSQQGAHLRLFLRRLIDEGECPKTASRPGWTKTDLLFFTRLRTQTFLIWPLSRLSPMSSSTLLLLLHFLLRSHLGSTAWPDFLDFNWLFLKTCNPPGHLRCELYFLAFEFRQQSTALCELML